MIWSAEDLQDVMDSLVLGDGFEKRQDILQIPQGQETGN